MSEKVNKKVANFYDDFVNKQVLASCNERHLFMIESLESLGMNKKSSVLEIGCGVGIITTLLAPRLTEGELVSNDISPKSVENAKKNNANYSYIEYVVGDIMEKLDNRKFDFITLFDVLEHIPIENHDQLFHKFSSLMHEGSHLLINIPSPDYLKHVTEHNPELLQVIDQPLDTTEILIKAKAANLRLVNFNNYGLWHDEEYNLFHFRGADTWKFVEYPERKITLIDKIKTKLGKNPKFS